MILSLIIYLYTLAFIVIIFFARVYRQIRQIKTFARDKKTLSLAILIIQKIKQENENYPQQPVEPKPSAPLSVASNSCVCMKDT